MNIKNLILVIGFSIISACASNEASMDVDESNAEVAKDEPVAAMEESKTEIAKQNFVNSNDKWKNELNLYQQDSLNKVLREYLIKFGYE